MNGNALVILLIFPTFLYADPVYKCNPTDDLTAYSDTPCKTAPTTKIIVKENTLDHSQMRKSKSFGTASPNTASDKGSSTSISVIPLSEGVGYRKMPPLSTNTGSNLNNQVPNTAVTTQPWR